ncbi:MAG: type II toxin-antitoxin system VapC family toxin [Prochlorothrix sp.]
MKLLLDTHTLMWWDSQFDRIPPKTQAILQNSDHEVWISVVSLWEMQIKSQLGKLTLQVPLEELINYQQQVNGLKLLSVTVPHILELDKLPLHHRDPFDRLLIAQSRVETAILVSQDTKMQMYNCQILWQ